MDGKGGYSVGYKYFTSGTVLYVCVGGAGGMTNSVGAAGYNGGGNGSAYRYNNGAAFASSGYGGGGATHIALVSGTLAQIGAGNISKVLIVAGGGGSKGDGGGLTGGNGDGVTGGTQTGPGACAHTWGDQAGFGKGGGITESRDNMRTDGGGRRIIRWR